MKNKVIKKIIHQVIYNPQVSLPPVSYSIKDVNNCNDKSYKSDYIDVRDFKNYIKRLEKALNERLSLIN